MIWRDYPIFGVLCIALFAVLQWAKYVAKGAQDPEEAAEWRKTDWRSQPIEMAHAGDSDRQIGGVGELGMGGPNFWTLLLRDGAIVHSACAAPQDVEDGKLRLIPTRSREGEGLTVYEPAARMMYALPALTDREQAALAAGSAQALARLRARCRQAEATPLRQVRGLWVPQWAEDPADRLAIALPSGRRWRRARCCRRICAMRTILPRCCTRRLMSCCWITGRPISSCAISIAWRNPRRVTA